MPQHADLRKVMVIGSGPIVIGQAAEFDYAGTQACKALKEVGLKVVLVNNNPATIMTDTSIADTVYLEPLTAERAAAIIARERPDGLLPTLGGQTGLNLAVELARTGVLDKYGVRLLGTPLSTIQRAEDRELFRNTMMEIGEPVPRSTIVTTVADACQFAQEVGYPVIVRPAYTLGGTGGGIATNEEQLVAIVTRGLRQSAIGQVLLEVSVAGWKEIEYEVMRDAADNCITVCNMENIDPIGIHTGDSIVVAPSQTLSDKEYQMLRSASLRIIRRLGIEGGCNIQFALNPHSDEYYVIEVNPRVSRSSALASKATGYPIAKVAAQIAVGLHLDEIQNSVTGKTCACFEPALDYVVTKIPRWPFDKFVGADRFLGTQMKATGEVMAIGRTLEESLLKAVRSLETGVSGLHLPQLSELTDSQLEFRLSRADDERLFLLTEALRRGRSVTALHRLTGIDCFFLEKLSNVVQVEARLKALSEKFRQQGQKFRSEKLFVSLLREAKGRGFSDECLAELLGTDAGTVRRLRQEAGIRPVYKMVDTCSAEFAATTPYYYSTYDDEDEVETTSRPKALVLGSGPIRIGQGVEFDYCSVHSVWALREAGYEAIIINNNPETVSTDFDTADRLYFEPLTPEDVLNVIDKEKPEGVIVQFGGQTAINLAEPLARAGVKILGTSLQSIDVAEDRKKFGELLSRLGIPQAEGSTATSTEEALGIALKIGFPVLVRPSYVLGGRAMEVVHNEKELWEYMQFAVKVSPRYPVLVDRYIAGRELEVDAISDGETVIIPGIMEHIERAGVHSGDSFAVFPPQNLTEEQSDTIVAYTMELARALNVKGLINVQFVVEEDRVYVIEVNPRASRTVPFLSKVTGVPMVKLATEAALGRSLARRGWRSGLLPPPPFVTIKGPVFSFEKLASVDTFLGPEMKSTGEVLGMGTTYSGALLNAFAGAGLSLPEEGVLLASLADRDKERGAGLLRRFAARGFRLLATPGTYEYLVAIGVPAEPVKALGSGHPDPLDLIRQGAIDLVINTPTRGKLPGRMGFELRRTAVEMRVPCLTSLDTASAFLAALEQGAAGEEVLSLNEFLRKLPERSCKVIPT